MKVDTNSTAKSTQSAFLAALGVLLLWQWLGADILQGFGLDGDRPLALYLVIKASFAVALGVVLSISASWCLSGFCSVRGWRSLWVGAPVWVLAVLIMLSPAKGGGSLTAMETMGWVAMAFAVGFGEEGLFRGLCWAALQNRGKWTLALGSSLAFGVVHMMGLFSEVNAGIIFAQCFFAIAVGTVFAAIRLRSPSIWPLVFIHTVFDAVAIVKAGGGAELMEPGMETYLRFLIPGGLILLWGLFFIHRFDRRKIEPQLARNLD